MKRNADAVDDQDPHPYPDQHLDHLDPDPYVSGLLDPHLNAVLVR
jgi:hypothetical protein